LSYLVLETAAGTGSGQVARALRPAPFGVFRLVLALLVLLQHAAAQVAPPVLRQAVGPLEPGSIAVFMFFVLSGYIIAEAGEHIYSGRPVAFLANRLLRIVPTYLVGLAIMVAVSAAILASGRAMPVVDAAPLFLDHLTSPGFYLANILALVPFGRALIDPAQPIVIGIIWAVRVELLFYLLFFGALAVATYARLPIGRVLAVLGGGAMALWLMTAGSGGVFSNAPFFVLGVAAQQLPRSGEGSGRQLQVTLAFMAVALAAALWQLAAMPAPIAGTDLVRQTPQQIGLFLSLLATFGFLATVPFDGASALGRLDRRLGELTYPLYINHMLVVTLLLAFVPLPNLAGFAAAMVGGIAVPAAIAALSEPAIGRLRDMVRGRRLG